MPNVEKGNHSGNTVVSKPTLDEELKTFKAIVRHITKYEIEPKAVRWFTADNRPSIRRLSNLGISGHQPAIAAYCKMTRDEKGKVTDAIMKQKVANNPKAEKQLAEHRERSKQDQESKVIIRITRVATGASVRWQRKLSHRAGNGANPEEENCIKEEVSYNTRMIACTRCSTKQGIKGMQLKISVGFRAIHCNNCGQQERVFRNKCSCDAIWHQCSIHRVDPPFHTSK